MIKVLSEQEIDDVKELNQLLFNTSNSSLCILEVGEDTQKKDTLKAIVDCTSVQTRNKIRQNLGPYVIQNQSHMLLSSPQIFHNIVAQRSSLSYLCTRKFMDWRYVRYNLDPNERQEMKLLFLSWLVNVLIPILLISRLKQIFGQQIRHPLIKLLLIMYYLKFLKCFIYDQLKYLRDEAILTEDEIRQIDLLGGPLNTFPKQWFRNQKFIN